MKILHVSNSYRPFSGGVVQSIEATIATLHAHALDARLLSFDFHHHEKDFPWVTRLPSLFPFTYKGNRLIIPWYMKHHLKKVVDEYHPDIIHVHHPFLLGPLAASYARKKGIPVVFTHHTRYEEYHHYVPGPEWIKRKVIDYLVRNFCNKVDSIIAPGDEIARNLFWKTTTPIIVLPSSIQPFHVRKQMPVKRNGGALQLLTVSRFVPEKNLFFLIDACSHLTIPFEYRLVGYGPLLSDLKDYARQQLGAQQDNILFIERPAQDALRSLYDDADVFIFSSQTETQGLVIAEAMAAGVAIVALDANWLPDAVRTHQIGYTIDNPVEMAVAIERLYHHRGALTAFQQAAFAASRAYYPDEFFKKLHAAYQQVLRHIA